LFFWLGIATSLLVLAACSQVFFEKPSGLILTDAVLVGASTIVFAATFLGLPGFGTRQIKDGLTKPLRFLAALFIWIVSVVNTILVLESFPAGTPAYEQRITLVGILIPAGVTLILATKALST
jgi:hypothetical protein